MVALDNATQIALNQLAQTATQGVPLIQFLLSPWFIVIIIYMLIFTPFGVIGIFSLANRIKNWNRQRGGWLKMRKKLSNLHWINFWVRPTGRKANIRTEEGIEIELPLEIKEGMLGLEKDINNVHFESEKKQKKSKDKTVLDIHVEPNKKEIRGKLTPVQIEALRELVK
jgi:hypothetical protein